QHDVAALGTERHLHSVGKLVHAALESATSLLVERDHLGHAVMSSVYLESGTLGGRVQAVRTAGRPPPYLVCIPGIRTVPRRLRCRYGTGCWRCSPRA